MKKLTFALIAAAALAAACARTPTAPASRERAPVTPVHDGYLGSGNRSGPDSSMVRP
ncbi:MAG TPA: hypothetical protein VJT67_06990 [Longimicrobiaceae bacterium]|nr:hypothetical protein [Longimicrobiaceae bacterium]